MVLTHQAIDDESLILPGLSVVLFAYTLLTVSKLPRTWLLASGLYKINMILNAKLSEIISD